MSLNARHTLIHGKKYDPPKILLFDDFPPDSLLMDRFRPEVRREMTISRREIQIRKSVKTVIRGMGENTHRLTVVTSHTKRR